MTRRLASLSLLPCFALSMLTGHLAWQAADGSGQLRAAAAAALQQSGAGTGITCQINGLTALLEGVADSPDQLIAARKALGEIPGLHLPDNPGGVSVRLACRATVRQNCIALEGWLPSEAAKGVVRDTVLRTFPGAVVDDSTLKVDLLVERGDPVAAATAAVRGIRELALHFAAPTQAGHPLVLTGVVPDEGWKEIASELIKAAPGSTGLQAAPAVLSGDWQPSPGELAALARLVSQMNGGAFDLTRAGLTIRGTADPDAFAAMTSLKLPWDRISNDVRKIPGPLSGEETDGQLVLKGSISSDTDRAAVRSRLAALRPDLPVDASGLTIDPALAPISQKLADALPGQPGPLSGLPALHRPQELHFSSVSDGRSPVLRGMLHDSAAAPIIDAAVFAAGLDRTAAAQQVLRSPLYDPAAFPVPSAESLARLITAVAALPGGEFDLDHAGLRVRGSITPEQAQSLLAINLEPLQPESITWPFDANALVATSVKPEPGPGIVTVNISEPQAGARLLSRLDAVTARRLREDLAKYALTFEAGSAAITAAGEKKLDALAAAISRLPAEADVKFTILGHTDPGAEDAASMELSSLRARHVVQAMQDRGVLGCIFTVRTFSPSASARASSEQSAGRVEILLR